MEIEEAEQLKPIIKEKVLEIKSHFVNGSLELAKNVSEVTLENENIDKFINNCIIEGIKIYEKYTLAEEKASC